MYNYSIYSKQSFVLASTQTHLGMSGLVIGVMCLVS